MLLMITRTKFGCIYLAGRSYSICPKKKKIEATYSKHCLCMYPFQNQLCFLVGEDSHNPKNTNTPLSYEDLKESIRCRRIFYWRKFSSDCCATETKGFKISTLFQVKDLLSCSGVQKTNERETYLLSYCHYVNTHNTKCKIVPCFK